MAKADQKNNRSIDCLEGFRGQTIESMLQSLSGLDDLSLKELTDEDKGLLRTTYFDLRNYRENHLNHNN